MNAVGPTPAPQSLEEAERLDAKARQEASAVLRRRVHPVAT
jgi:hypothetical protein